MRPVCALKKPPFFAHELRERLGKDDQGVQREQRPLSCQSIPKPIEATLVAGKATNIGVGKGALIETRSQAAMAETDAFSGRRIDPVQTVPLSERFQ
jgi:hypothetical protein